MDSTAFIIAGGRSSRFGEDKALYPYGNRTLLEHVIEAIRPVIQRIAIIADEDGRYNIPGIPCHSDIVPGYGPLGGLHTALNLIESGSAFLFACDMPHLNTELIQYMLTISEGNDVTVPFCGGEYEPLHAIYSKQCLGPVEKCVRNNRRRIIAFYDDVAVRKVTEVEIRRFVDPQRTFRNINFREDLEDNTMETTTNE